MDPFTTNYYAAPETTSQQYSDKSDIWSLGIILYQLLAGFLPFGATTEKSKLDNLKEADFMFHKPEWQGISERCKDLIRMMLKP